MIEGCAYHSNRDLNIFHAMTIAMPINIPIKHRFLTADASSGLSVKKESTKPKIPVTKIMMTPHPRAALVAPKGAFFIVSPLFKLYGYPLIRSEYNLIFLSFLESFCYTNLLHSFQLFILIAQPLSSRASPHN